MRAIYRSQFILCKLQYIHLIQTRRKTLPMWVDSIMSLRIVTATYSLILTKGNVWVARKRLYNSKRSGHHLKVENPIVPHLTLDENSGKDGSLKSQDNSHLNRLKWSQKLGSWDVKQEKRQSKEDHVSMNVQSLRFRLWSEQHQ